MLALITDNSILYIIKVNYSIHDLQWENDTDCVTEEYCFATLKEAYEECKRRNKNAI